MYPKQYRIVGSRYERGMEARDGRPEGTQKSRKPLASKGFSFVAGAGFEPATFGL